VFHEDIEKYCHIAEAEELKENEFNSNLRALGYSV
jgi:hypothetical protein